MTAQNSAGGTDGLRFSASVTFLFPGQPACRFVPLLAQAGFTAVEFQRLDQGEAERHAPHLARAGLAVAVTNLDIGDFVAGGPGLSGVPGRAHEFAAALERGYADALVLGARLVHVGPCRVPIGQARDDYAAQLRDNIRRARDRLAPQGIGICVEALNSHDYPDLLIRRPENVLELLDELGKESLFLQYDIYHSAVDGRDVAADIARFAPSLGHVQFADHPGRHEPGSGQLPLQHFFRSLRHAGYSGFIGAEYLPATAVEHTFDWLVG